VNTSFALQIRSELNQEQTEAFLQIPEQIGLTEFLKKYPLDSLSFAKTVMVDTREVNGVYNFLTQEVSISLVRSSSDFGQSYQKQRIWSISALARTREAAIQRTFVHELGHHVHRTLRELDISVFRFTMMTPRSDALSQYGLDSAFEHFAESFSAYVFHRVELALDDSFGYAMIQRVLIRLGLELEELP
jgi:hypothetical protein